MYLEHFGFDREPFNITPDSRFLFLSRRHREAMAALLYGIEQRKGFIALTGEIGSGKTTICRSLLKELDKEHIRLALVLNPQLNDLELLQAINAEYGIAHESTSKRELLDKLNKFLLEQYGAGKNCVLVIDESQRLSTDALEQVRLISNLELEDTKLIQIALVGQPELDDVLHLPELEQLNSRIMVRYHIDPLDFEEMSEYIAHRLTIANPKKEVKFDKKALKAIFKFTGGVPRRVNVVCDRALLCTFVDHEIVVKEPHALKAIEEVRGKRGAKRRGTTSAASIPAIRPSREEVKVEKKKVEEPAPDPVLDELDELDVEEISETPAAPEEREGGEGDGEEPKKEPSKAMAMAAIVTVALVAAGFFFSDSFGGTEGKDRGSNNSLTTAAATPTPAPSPSPTPVPATPTPAPTAQPSPTPAPSPSPTIAPTPLPVIRTVAPAPAPELEWSYDVDKVMRVRRPEFGYAAAVLTWLALDGSELGAEELATLRTSSPVEVASMKLAGGQAPLFLREARLPPMLDLLKPSMMPAIVQVDRSAGEFGPWTLILERTDEGLIIADPIRGRLRVTESLVNKHLAGIVVLYRDPDGITGLDSMAAGDNVKALQRLLAATGYYEAEPSGVYDKATERAVSKYREKRGLPGGPKVDPTLAMVLLREATP